MATKRKQKSQPDYDYRDTHEEDHGVAVVGKNGKFGYINRRGVEITPLVYDRALRFYWDAGRVQLDGKWGLVNRQGKEIAPPVYDEIKGHQDPIVRVGDKYGFVSRKTGKLLTPVKYDDAKQWIQIFNFTSLQFGKKDLAPVQLDGKWGCINVRGEEIIPVKYEKIDVNQSENPRILAKLDGKWGFVNENGKEITAFEYDDIKEFRSSRARVKKDGKYGFIDTKGDTVIPLSYDDCESRFTWVYDSEDNKREMPIWVKCGERYGFIDIDGKEIIEPKYEQALPFDFISDGMILAATVVNGAAGFIDETGKSVIPFMYEPDFEKWNYRFYNGFANVRHGGKWGVIDTENNVVVPFRYDEFLENRNAGFRYAMREGKKLSIDAKGNEREMKKNPAAPAFKDYLCAVSWEDVAETFRTLFCMDEETVDNDMKIWEINFYNFKSKQFKPSENIIRIFADDGKSDWERPPLNVILFNTVEECSYAIFDWEEILDMEVHIEDNLVLSNAEIVAACIWDACDQWPVTENGIKKFIRKLDEQSRTIDENK